MPELLWKAYIDFEVEEGEREKARALYERLCESSGHWKVWVAFAMFEAAAIQLPREEREEDEEDEEAEVKMVEGDVARARQVFQRGYNDLRSKGLKDEVCFTSSYIMLIRVADTCRSVWPCCKCGRTSKRSTESRTTSSASRS